MCETSTSRAASAGARAASGESATPVSMTTADADPDHDEDTDVPVTERRDEPVHAGHDLAHRPYRSARSGSSGDGAQVAVQAPSTAIDCPLTYDACSESRKETTAATSLGSPTLRSGGNDSRVRSAASGSGLSLDPLLEERRPNPSGGDGVDAHADRAVLDGEVPGQRIDAPLGGVVGGVVCDAAAAVDRTRCSRSRRRFAARRTRRQRRRIPTSCRRGSRPGRDGLRRRRDDGASLVCRCLRC